MENMFCNTVQAELTRKGVGQKFTEHISENQGFGTNRLARAQTISSHSHHFDRHDWVLQRKGARIFMILYKNNLCSLVWDGRTALDVRPFCVKICQLGLIFQFSILLVLEGSLSLAESIFLVLMSQWEMRRDNRVILVLWKLN